MGDEWVGTQALGEWARRFHKMLLQSRDLRLVISKSNRARSKVTRQRR